MQDRLNLGSRVGMKALERAVAHHRRALIADPRYTPAALALARLTLSLSDTARLAQSIPALRKAAEAASAGADVVLAYGRVERASGSLGAAAGAFRQYLTLGTNRALGQLELARTLLASGSPEGQIAYYEGASLADARTSSDYQADLVPLVGDTGVRHLVGLTGERLALALAHFWNDRDRLEFRSQGERLREHYRRLQYARLHFPLTISRRFYGGPMPIGRVASSSTTAASSTSGMVSPRSGFALSCSAPCPMSPGSTAGRTGICFCISVVASTETAEAISTITGWFKACSTYVAQPTHPGPTAPVPAVTVPDVRSHAELGPPRGGPRARAGAEHWGGKYRVWDDDRQL